jgi:UDP-glucose 4-epimerase
VLRLGFRLSEDTFLTRYLSLPIVPTFAGFDPRLQFLHEEDAADAIVRATMGHHPGVFNIGGAGVVLLSQAISIMGGRALPVLPPYGRPLARTALRAIARLEMPAHLPDLLAFGSVMDGSRVKAQLGWSPTHSSREVMEALARGKDAEVIEAPSPPQEYELQVYLQRRRRAEGNASRALPVSTR